MTLAKNSKYWESYGRVCLSAELHTHTHPHLLIGAFDLPFSLTDEFLSGILKYFWKCRWNRDVGVVLIQIKTE